MKHNRGMKIRGSFAEILALLFVSLWILSAEAQEDPRPITDLSETETSYAGARLLSPEREIRLGAITSGRYGDEAERDRFLFWQGDSLFLGVIDTDEDNRLDVVAEFYWFESSLPRNSDFYVIVLKVTAAPSANTEWRIATPPSLTDSVLFRDIGAVHRVEASLDRTGESGAIRWDWSLPFQNYRWEPERVIEVEQEYAAGVHLEGSAMRDLSEGTNVQAKGFLDAQTRVSTRYTITLWRWEMLVQAGATDMDWALVALSPEHEQDPAYHEYFLVLQAERGTPVLLNYLQFATTMRKRRPLYFDDFKDISVRLQNIELSPPRNPCERGYRYEGDRCIPDCPPQYEWIDEQCQLTCSEGYEPVDEECLERCPDDYERIGRDCELICPPDTLNVNGVCESVCEDGSLSEEGVCEDPCPEGSRLEGGVCVNVCDADMTWRDGECRPRCPDEARFDGQRCVCPEGSTLDVSGCTPQCGEGLRYDGSMCVTLCPEGTRYAEGACVPDDGLCESGYIWRDQRCVSVCPEGFVISEGLCQSICPEGSRYQEGRCVTACPEGTRLIDNICVTCPSGSSFSGDECVADDDKTTSSESCRAYVRGSSHNTSHHTSLLLVIVLGVIRVTRIMYATWRRV